MGARIGWGAQRPHPRLIRAGSHLLLVGEAVAKHGIQLTLK